MQTIRKGVKRGSIGALWGILSLVGTFFLSFIDQALETVLSPTNAGTALVREIAVKAIAWVLLFPATAGAEIVRFVRPTGGDAAPIPEWVGVWVLASVVLGILGGLLASLIYQRIRRTVRASTRPYAAP